MLIKKIYIVHCVFREEIYHEQRILSVIKNQIRTIKCP